MLNEIGMQLELPMLDIPMISTNGMLAPNNAAKSEEPLSAGIKRLVPLFNGQPQNLDTISNFSADKRPLQSPMQGAETMRITNQFDLVNRRLQPTLSPASYLQDLNRPLHAPFSRQ